MVYSGAMQQEWRLLPLLMIECMFVYLFVLTIGPKGSLTSKYHQNKATNPEPHMSSIQTLPSSGIQMHPQHVPQWLKNWDRTCLVP